MQCEAVRRQGCERAAVAPIKGQETTGLAGGRTGETIVLDDGRLDPTEAHEIGDRGADHAAAADRHVHRFRAFRNDSAVNGPDTMPLDITAPRSAHFGSLLVLPGVSLGPVRAGRRGTRRYPRLCADYHPHKPDRPGRGIQNLRSDLPSEIATVHRGQQAAAICGYRL
jgi:hypothetical protein